MPRHRTFSPPIPPPGHSGSVPPGPGRSVYTIDSRPGRRLPLFVWLVFAGLITAGSLGHYSILGFKITGWSWLIPLLVGLLMCIGSFRHIRFPYGLWLPWAIVLVSGLARPANRYALQATVQMLCPLVVGLAASTIRMEGVQWRRLLTALRWLTVVFFVVIILDIPMIMMGRLPTVTGLAPEAISAVFLATVYLVLVVERGIGDVIYLAGCMAVPVIAVTRGATGALLMMLLLAPVRIRLHTRMVLAVAAVAFGLFLFHTPQMQRKMFWSGRGELQDVRWENPDFATSGRSVMWKVLWAGVRHRPWTGHGANAASEALMRRGYRTYQPHNDWLRIVYDYGLPMAMTYLIAIVLQVRLALRRSRTVDGVPRLLFLSGAAAFVPLVFIMLVDNVIVYAQYYNNLHFLLLGLAHGNAAPRAAPMGRPPAGPQHPWPLPRSPLHNRRATF